MATDLDLVMAQLERVQGKISSYGTTPTEDKLMQSLMPPTPAMIDAALAAGQISQAQHDLLLPPSVSVQPQQQQQAQITKQATTAYVKATAPANQGIFGFSPWQLAVAGGIALLVFTLGGKE